MFSVSRQGPPRSRNAAAAETLSLRNSRDHEVENMTNWLRAALAAGVLAVSAGAVNAQGVELRLDTGDRYERVQRDRDRFDRDDLRSVQYRDYDRPRYRDRDRMRDRRRVREVCRTEVRRRVRPNGVVVERPVRVCRRVVIR
jgi:hypothetical protein